MALSVGSKLGTYEILAPIGAGGMGEVYRARDAKLNRDVALKVLPEPFASDPDRIARFKREAHVLAALNHPNIAAIYGFEDTGGVHAIVLELVDGPTLADRIVRGPVPVDEALVIARQIGEALEAAHEIGVIHRDLKPANIKVTQDGRVKILDFGLAKLLDSEGAAFNSSATSSPTITTPAMTGIGAILGTAAYMAPEQARGRAADRRCDIWAFGCVLYEMFTGKRAFPGEDATETLAAVIKSEPDFSAIPPHLITLLRTCLVKDPKRRLQAIGDAWLLLKEDMTSHPRRNDRFAWTVAFAAIVVSAAIFAWLTWRRAPAPSRPLIRFDVSLGPNVGAGTTTTTALSPDGSRIVFPVRTADGKEQLATRLLAEPATSTLPGTEGASEPFFSPDGQWVGFFADGWLKKVSLRGGAAQRLCEVFTARGASWGADGNIVLGIRNTAGLSVLPDSGGVPSPLTELASGEATHRWPQVLPGSDAVLFTASPNVVAYENATIEVFSKKTGKSKHLVEDAYFGRYLPASASTGYLVYIREATLFAAPFDPLRLETRGPAVPILDDISSSSGLGRAQFAFSNTGMFFYTAGQPSDQSWPIVWLNSSGKTEPLPLKPAAYDVPRLSPDGQRLAVQIASGRTRDLYIYDFERDTLSRLTYTGGSSPTWSPDGQHLVFSIGRTLWWIRADGSGEPQRLFENDKNNVNPYSFSFDGRYLTYFETTPDTLNDVWIASLNVTDSEHPKWEGAEPFEKTRFGELEGSFSPDGRWIAYRSNQSGVMELYVRPFKGSGKWQVSSGEGVMHPRWSPSGQELLYETLDGRIMVADYTVQKDSFVVSNKPRLWSPTPILMPSGAYNMDVAPDGKRIIAFAKPQPPPDQGEAAHFTILLNFVDELGRRVPTN
jgi:serine/threonine-protein kinase